MTIRKKNFLVPFVLALLVLAGLYVRNFLKPKRFNILVLSTCSLSAGHLGLYNHAANGTTPNIEALANQSYVFENAITDRSWSNIAGFLSNIPAAHLITNGYTAIGMPWGREELQWQPNGKQTPTYHMRIPSQGRVNPDRPSSYWEDLESIKNKILNRSHWPFFLEVHNKIVHFPYLKPSSIYKSNEEWLSPGTVQYINDYRRNFLKYPERLPFGLFVMSRTKHFSKAVIKMLSMDRMTARKLRKSLFAPTMINLLNNEQLIKRWKDSPFFEEDLRAIKETYSANLKLLDSSLSQVLQLYGNRDLLENTVIIFSGDHGEAFFEHGYMAHGESVFDEMIKFPLFIKFPGQSRGKRVKVQFYQQGIEGIVRKIIAGEINVDNFEKYILEENNHPLIYSRTCSNSMQSLRYKNEWKYIWDIKKDQKYLFNLARDPFERENVFEKNLHMASYLEEKLDEVSTDQPQNRYLLACSPAY